MANTDIEVDSTYEKFSKERKELQAKGLVPPWVSTGGYQMFKTKYLYRADSWKEQIERIAKTAAKHTDNPVEWESKFFDILWKGWLSPSTPVLANMGTDRGLPVSCSGSYVADDVGEFYLTAAEVAMLSKWGFGTSAYLGDIRHRGASISRGGTASGILPVLKNLKQVCSDVAQSGTRRGSGAWYLPITHKDFWEVLGYLEGHPDDLNIGWNISDEFIEGLDKGNQEYLSRYQAAMRVKMTLGKGYFFFIDKVNRHRPESYVKNNLEVKASNLCVAPETLILTDKGYQEIKSLDGCTVNVWNGSEWSEVVVRKTSGNQKLLKVKTDAGLELECTPYHKFFVSERDKKTLRTRVYEKKAEDLKPGDTLIKSKYPIIDGSETLLYPYENGFFTGDGFESRDTQVLYFYHQKEKLLEHIDTSIFTSIRKEKENKRTIARTTKLQRKFFVPDCAFTVNSRLQWFAGLCDSDGTVARNGNTQSLQIGSINKDFLLSTQKMLHTLGVDSKLNFAKDEGYNELPTNDGTGGNKKYWTQKCYRLLIGQTGLNNLMALGFKTHRLLLKEHTPNREATHFIKVAEVLDEGRYDDTYCFTEPKRGMGIFNGILTGQCSEITLHSSKDLTFTCVLSSMNVALYDEWKDTDAIFTATVFLDCVCEEFIQKSKDIPLLKKARDFTIKGRALGLGQMGLFSLFQKRRLDPEAFEAHSLNTAIAANIFKESERASRYLANIHGEPEWCKGTGLRNTHRLAIAPTKSTALLMGGWSEGINPDPAMVFTSSGSAGDIDRVNPVLLEIMKERKVFNKKTIQEILANSGSVSKVSWLTPEEKKAFKTAFEIDQYSLIRLAETRQRYVDQGQSLNLFFAHNDDGKYISGVHEAAFRSKWIHGLYYVYSNTDIKADRTGECEACQ